MEGNQKTSNKLLESETDLKQAENSKNVAENVPQDPDLDDLLDSALEDFDKPAPPPVEEIAPIQTSQAQASQQTAQNHSTPGSDDLSSQQEAMFNELFNMAGGEEGQAGLEEMMKQLMGGQPDLVQQLENMTDNFDNLGQAEAGDASVDEALQQTVNNLAQNVQGMQDAPPADDLLRMLSGMGLGDTDASGDSADLDFMPMMQNMMKGLMSKEVLYPSLKDISVKYPAWLEENKSKLDKKDFDNYTRQYEMMKIIVTEFENENSTDSEEVKKLRFDRILNVMQQMQELGQPPKDIVGEMPPGFEMTENGLPKFPGVNPDQCSVM